jgi:hypothetical protein
LVFIMNKASTSIQTAQEVIGSIEAIVQKGATLSHGMSELSLNGVAHGEEFSEAMGTFHTQPNIFGGQDITFPDQTHVQSQPNIFGGVDIQLPGGGHISTHPNIFGGEDGVVS